MLQDVHLVRRFRYRSLGGELLKGSGGYLSKMETMVSRNSISFLRPKLSPVTPVCSNHPHPTPLMAHSLYLKVSLKHFGQQL